MARTQARASPRIFIILAVLFGVVTVGLIIFILVREMTLVQQLQDRCGSEVQFLAEKFPGYFRTAEEQRDFIRLLEESESGRPETQEANNCRFNCFGENPRRQQPPLRKRRDTTVRWTYHSCCQSYKNHSSNPTFRTSIRGVTRELVQTDTYKQYFTEESCGQTSGCSGCSCSQPDPDIKEAVVYKDKNAVLDSDKYELDHLKFAGCCKCLNIAEQ